MAHTSLKTIKSGKAMQKWRQDHAKLKKKHWRTQEKTMENGAAQAKSEGQNRCTLLEKGRVTLRWHTPLSRPFNRRRLCKSEGKTIQNCRKHTGGPKKKPWKMKRHKPKVKVKTYMELSNTRQVHTSCIWGWHTKMAHRNWRSCLECLCHKTWWGNERLDGIFASFCVCHLIAAPI